MTTAPEDPRLTGKHVRSVTSTAGTVTLVGVVHDHPASVYRVRRVLEAREPDVLALELPPISLSLFEAYARDVRTPPVFGGEMSAAIQAADTDDVVGIDGPTTGFTLRLARTLVRERASRSTVKSVIRGLYSVSKDAVRCRLAGAIAALTSVRLEVNTPLGYEVTREDDPASQAADERTQIRRARAVMDTFEPSRAVQFRDATREAHMADQLIKLRQRGDVVAVVGRGHLDVVVEHVAGTTDRTH